jgi:integrase
MRARRLTPALLLNLKPPVKGLIELFDDRARGLSLRVFTSGRSSWSFRYRPKGGFSRRRMDLGEYPAIGLAEARRRAFRIYAQVSGGEDPQGELDARRQEPTLEELVDRYLKSEVAPKKKEGTFDLYSYYLERLVLPRLGKKKAQEVTPADVERLHRKLGKRTPVTANRTVVCLSAVYSFGARRRLIPIGTNPTRGIGRFPEKSRERYLSTEELGRLGQVLRRGETEGLAWPSAGGRSRSKHDRKPENRKTLLSRHVTGALRLLLLTGCRLREILHLRWSEVDFEHGLLLLPDSKTGRKTIVLNAPALQELAALQKISAGPFVILGDSPKKPRADLRKPWDIVRHHASLKDVRIHDLRHTHASIGAAAGMGLPIIGKLLGHKHVETTARYAHLDADPLRRASDRIADTIVAAMGEENRPKADVVRLSG